MFDPDGARDPVRFVRVRRARAVVARHGSPEAAAEALGLDADVVRRACHSDFARDSDLDAVESASE